MPLYEFKKLSDGTIHELPFPMSKVPAIGDTVTLDGREYVRIPPNVGTEAARTVCSKYPYVARSLPDLPECPKNRDGHNIVKSRRHERELMSKYDLERA